MRLEGVKVLKVRGRIWLFFGVMFLMFLDLIVCRGWLVGGVVGESDLG